MASPAHRDLAVAILAAGEGRRFGGAKQDVLIDGRPMLRLMVEGVRSALHVLPMVVVRAERNWSHGFGADEAELVLNPRAAEGIGTSIGMAAAAAASRDARALMIVLGDQPRLAPSLLREVASAAQDDRIIAVRYSESVIAPPVAFGAKFFPTLTMLTGDRGAKRVMDAFPQSVSFIDTTVPFRDVDVPDDALQLV